MKCYWFRREHGMRSSGRWSWNAASSRSVIRNPTWNYELLFLFCSICDIYVVICCNWWKFKSKEGKVDYYGTSGLLVIEWITRFIGYQEGLAGLLITVLIIIFIWLLWEVVRLLTTIRVVKNNSVGRKTKIGVITYFWVTPQIHFFFFQNKNMNSAILNNIVLILPLDAHMQRKKEIFSPAMPLSLSLKNPKPIRPLPIGLPRQKKTEETSPAGGCLVAALPILRD